MSELISSVTRKVENKLAFSEMTINPEGARIEGLFLDGSKILTSVLRGDGRKASTHPCTPNFGPETITSFGLPQHGPMRNEFCAIEQVGDHVVDLFHEIKSGTYPEGLVVTQRFFVSSQLFSLVTTHINMGEMPAPLNFGEHFYFHVPTNWEGLRINGEDVTDMVKNDEIIPLNRVNEILIPGQRKLTLIQEGLPRANLWVYQDEQSGKYDTHYVCIEPVERNPKENPFGSEESMLAPNSACTCKISITV